VHKIAHHNTLNKTSIKQLAYIPPAMFWHCPCCCRPTRKYFSSTVKFLSPETQMLAHQSPASSQLMQPQRLQFATNVFVGEIDARLGEKLTLPGGVATADHLLDTVGRGAALSPDSLTRRPVSRRSLSLSACLFLETGTM